jgi:hypothetical protein
MTVKQQIEQELARLAAANPTGTEPLPFSLPVGAGTLDAAMTAVDSIACAFAHLSLVTDRLADATREQLQAVGEQLAARLNYLLEPIGVVEVDPRNLIVQLRSTPPQRDENGSAYYELLVKRGGEVRLTRYAKATGAARTPIPACVTREVFCRLAEDFSAALS